MFARELASPRVPITRPHSTVAMSDAPTRADDAIAVAPAPNWYGSSLADWGGAGGSLCAYAARNVVVLVRPRDARAQSRAPSGTPTA